MITRSLQYHGTSVLLGIAGNLDQKAGTVLQRALDSIESSDRVLMIDMHQVPTMDTDGLLHVLDLHRRADCLGLRTLIIGWQPQPQQLMATIAGTPGAGAGERYAVAGFRRLLQDRAQRVRDRAESTTGSLPLA